MAKQKHGTTASQEVVERDPNAGAVAVLSFQEDAGKGMEGADRESFAIPFLALLQANSPQVVESSIPNAKAGMFINSVTNELLEAPIVVPCAFQRRWVRWGAREAGGGFKGEMTPAQANELMANGTVKNLDGRYYYPAQDGSINPKKEDRLSDTRSHFCLVLRTPTDELPFAAVLALTSTGIKTSKNFLSRIESIRLRGNDGRLFNPPSFSHMYRVKTVLKSNEKGKWWQPEVEMVGPISNPAIYAAAKAFHKQVSEGRVDIAHDSVSGGDDEGGGGGSRDDGRF